MAKDYINSTYTVSKGQAIQENSEHNEAITRLIAGFQNNPQKYFAEAELQYELYCILKSSKLINKSVLTNDGISVSTVHPEYPSVDRVQLKAGKGYRVWFDLAVLNPDFVRSNDYRTVWARNEHDAKSGTNNVLAAFEFKYFPVKRTHDLRSVEEDCLKLSLCKEIKDRYVLTFSNYEVEASVVQGIDLGTATLFWATPKSLYFREP
jgi:hypothetical protein